MIDTNNYEVQYWGRDFRGDEKPYFVVRCNNGAYAEYFRLDPDSTAFDFFGIQGCQRTGHFGPRISIS